MAIGYAFFAGVALLVVPSLVKSFIKFCKEDSLKPQAVFNKGK